MTFTEGGVVIGTTVAGNAGAWTFTPVGLANGTQTITASETDGAGNVGTASLTFTLDTTAPTVTSIAASVANGDLNAGHTVTLTVNFSTAVYATTAQYVTLNDGGKATYLGGSGTTALTFNYTVAAGQNTPNLAVTGLSAGLTDIAGNKAALGTVLTNPGNTLIIDTTAPKISSITTFGRWDSFGQGGCRSGKHSARDGQF